MTFNNPSEKNLVAPTSPAVERKTLTQQRKELELKLSNLTDTEVASILLGKTTLSDLANNRVNNFTSPLGRFTSKLSDIANSVKNQLGYLKENPIQYLKKSLANATVTAGIFASVAGYSLNSTISASAEAGESKRVENSVSIPAKPVEGSSTAQAKDTFNYNITTEQRNKECKDETFSLNNVVDTEVTTSENNKTQNKKIVYLTPDTGRNIEQVTSTDAITKKIGGEGVVIQYKDASGEIKTMPTVLFDSKGDLPNGPHTITINVPNGSKATLTFNKQSDVKTETSVSGTKEIATTTKNISYAYVQVISLDGSCTATNTTKTENRKVEIDIPSFTINQSTKDAFGFDNFTPVKDANNKVTGIVFNLKNGQNIALNGESGTFNITQPNGTVNTFTWSRKVSNTSEGEKYSYTFEQTNRVTPCTVECEAFNSSITGNLNVGVLSQEDPLNNIAASVKNSDLTYNRTTGVWNISVLGKQYAVANGVAITDLTGKTVATIRNVTKVGSNVTFEFFSTDAAPATPENPNPVVEVALSDARWKNELGIEKATIRNNYIYFKNAAGGVVGAGSASNGKQTVVLSSTVSIKITVNGTSIVLTEITKSATPQTPVSGGEVVIPVGGNQSSAPKSFDSFTGGSPSVETEISANGVTKSMPSESGSQPDISELVQQ